MGTIKTRAQEILRWGAIAASGGFAAWMLVEAGRCGVGIHRRGVLDASGVMMLMDPVLVALPFLAVAYICFRRQYRKLFLVLGVVGCIAVFCELFMLPDQLGFWD
jgi:hypothetical protein